MNLADIIEKFKHCKSWEERYRLLIQLSRQLPKPTETEFVELPEIQGCESHLWFKFELEPRLVIAYSDARLMQGILVIITLALTEKTAEELSTFRLSALFEELKITPNLTSTRLNGINQIQKIIDSSVKG